MKAILFLDDWMIEHRDSLERVWGRPELVKELFTDFYPGFLGYGGYMTVFHDEQVGRYVLVSWMKSIHSRSTLVGSPSQ